jgi:AbrB family looped-hinge helix DNA binding protein
MSTTVTTKGQVTIPKRIRDLLGIAPGDAVDFVMDQEGRIVLRKHGAEPSPPSRFARFAGTATAGLSTDEIMAMTRGEE